MNVQPEHEMAPEVNTSAPVDEQAPAPVSNSAPTADVPAGWVKLYTRENKIHLVPESEVDNALREGLLTRPFDLDAALADFNAAIEDARVSVPKAIAESIATGYERDEDAWIINDCMAKVRDSFAALIFSAGAVLPTEADVHAIREYIEDEPKRAALRAEMERLTASGQPIPDGMEKNANGSPHHEALAKKHAAAVSRLPDDKFQARKAQAEADRAERAAVVAGALQARVRSLQIAGHPVELVNGVMHRKHPETGELRPADPNTGELLPEPEEEAA